MFDVLSNRKGKLNNGANGAVLYEPQQNNQQTVTSEKWVQFLTQMSHGDVTKQQQISMKQTPIRLAREPNNN
jgi:hypothetical protein